MAEKQHVPSIIVTRGLPGSGKTSWCLTYLSLFPKSVRVSRDDLRKGLFNKSGRLSREEENLITKAEDALVIAGLADGNDVLVDATNLPARAVKRFAKLGPVHQQIFNTPPEECIARQAGRDRKVPAEVINGMAARFMQKGRIPEAVIDNVKPVAVRKYEPNTELPDALWIDVDGTLANHHGIRDPHDTSRYVHDTLHEDVADLVGSLAADGYSIVICSGRSDEFRDVTETWLNDNGIRYDELYMRAEGDDRRDDVVKLELLFGKDGQPGIADKYNIVGAFDDRYCLFSAFRAAGVRVYQVAPGAF